MRFWIQEQAPDGGYFDSIGLDPHTDLESAKEQARSWQAAWPDRKVRLIVRVDTVIEYMTGLPLHVRKAYYGDGKPKFGG